MFEVWLLEDHSVVRLLCAFVVRSLNLVLCYFNEIFSDMNYLILYNYFNPSYIPVIDHNKGGFYSFFMNKQDIYKYLLAILTFFTLKLRHECLLQDYTEGTHSLYECILSVRK